MPNDNIEAVRQHQMVVARIRIRNTKKLKETKPKRSTYLIRTVNCSCSEILVIIPLTLVLRQTKASYEVKKGGKKINHLLFMDDLKLLAKNEDQMDSVVNTVRIFSEYIKMEFGLPKCEVLIMKRGKVVKSEGINMPDRKMMKNIEEGGCKYLGILEADGVKHEEMKSQIKNTSEK